MAMIEIMHKLTRAEKDAVYSALSYYLNDASNLVGTTGLKGRRRKTLESAMHKLKGII